MLVFNTHLYIWKMYIAPSQETYSEALPLSPSPTMVMKASLEQLLFYIHTYTGCHSQ